MPYTAKSIFEAKATTLEPLHLATLAARTSRDSDADHGDMRVMLAECAHTIRELVKQSTPLIPKNPLEDIKTDELRAALQHERQKRDRRF